MSNGPDIYDDVVWSNFAYLLPVFFAPTWLGTVILGAAGLALAFGSGIFHATYSRRAQRMDVSAMMTYLAALTAAVATQWTLWIWLVVPAAAVVYWRWTWQIDSQIHVPAWGLMLFVTLAIRVGWWALLPAALFLTAGAIEVAGPGRDAWTHTIWHLLGGGAAATAMWLL